MRIYLILITQMISFVSFSQMQAINKVYAVEGMVADRETLKSIPFAILYNDSLGITTTSDEKGYFKLVVPESLIREKEQILIDIIKTGYKRDGSGFGYNPAITNTASEITWNSDIKIFWMAKNESSLSSTVSAQARAEEGRFGAPVIQQSFEQAVASELRSRKMEQLKQGNEKVFFLIDGKAALATASYDVYTDLAAPIVFIEDKRVKLTDINNRLKRSQAHVDWSKSDTLSKHYKKDVVAFTKKASDETPSFTSNLSQSITDTASKPPEFIDQEKTMASLKSEYKCERIEFENWEADDAVDNTLTVCLINSKNIPTAYGDKVYDQLKAIATQIKSALSHPEKYNSYYIIFVKAETEFGLTFKSHSLGANISSKEL